MMFSMRRSALAGSLVLGAGLLLAPTAPVAVADTRDTKACPGDPYYTVERIKIAYEPIGSTAGKRNAASSTSRLTYALSTTVSKATTWSAELGGTMKFAVSEVEAKLGVEVTGTVERGKTVTNWMDVPGGKYGYTTPKIQRSTFVIEKWADRPNCTARFIGNMGTLKAITAYPFFSECISTGPCTPKP
ncbi:hypothetical protein [Streptomyces ficellus]|uniref:Uncharacterized protein n=1 Tax=Streptomyces ficellus TaxID=1977088 RepID=A0A6I6FHF2_9ACTN|nr:hypothetical protein [Streptomyces ficellus]QGV79532.1 hypothetical protein EIZ62_15735 [Streptomyces ficellus]